MHCNYENMMQVKIFVKISKTEIIEPQTLIFDGKVGWGQKVFFFTFRKYFSEIILLNTPLQLFKIE